MERLLQQAADGDAEGVRKTLQTVAGAGVDVNAANRRGWTALHMAARYGQATVVDVLLANGASKTLRNADGKTPQDLAKFWGYEALAATLATATAAAPATEGTKETPTVSAADAIHSSGLNVVNFFAGNTLNRRSNERKADTWIALMAARQDALTVLFSGSKALFALNAPGKGSMAVALLPSEDLQQLRARNVLTVFLGTDTTTTAPYFAADLLEKAEDEALYEGKRGSFLSLRPAAFQLSGPNEAPMLAQARSMLDWNHRNRFCAMCGSATTSAEGGYKRNCGKPDCKTHASIQNMSYPRTDPVVISLCLLGRGKNFPETLFSCLAGFMEPGETIEEAVRREVVEETGIKVGVVRYHSSQPWPFPAQLMIGCIAEATSTDIQVDQDELVDARWFSRDEVAEFLRKSADLRAPGIKIPPKYALSHQLIKAWLDVGASKF